MAQTLAPRAYVITPVNANAITLSWSYFDGGLNFNGAIPVTGATGTYHVPVLSYYHSFNFFGRSANVVGFLPYGVGTFQGEVLGSQRQIYRSGLLDIAVRFSVNLMGGPGDEDAGIRQVETKEIARSQSYRNRSDWSVRPDASHQLGYQSMGVQTGIRLFAAMGSLGARWLRRSLVLHE